MKKYHPLLVALHWLLIPLLGLALIMGDEVLSHTANDAPEKIGLLKSHMIMGGTILVLMLVRFFTRIFSKHPAHIDTGKPLMDKLAVVAHGALYWLVFFMAASGIALAIQTGLPDIIFNGSGAALPADFHDFTPRLVHGLLSKVLLIMIVLHVLAAFYHQLILKDSIFSRIWFGNRKG
jgi:cytochrome b561